MQERNAFDPTQVRPYLQEGRDLNSHVRELERSNQELRRFATAVSHDIQEPLRNISLYAQLLMQSPLAEGPEERHLYYILDGSQKLSALIEDLLEFAKSKSRAELIERISIKNIVEQVLFILRPQVESSNALIEFTALPTILGSSSQIYQIFQNLISNALKFARPSVRPKISVGVERKVDHWLFWVKDNGIGIQPHRVEEIFQPKQKGQNHTKNMVGNGIGLSLCRRIIEGQGGKIWVESVPNEGSTFYFTVPLQ